MTPYPIWKTCFYIGNSVSTLSIWPNVRLPLKTGRHNSVVNYLLAWKTEYKNQTRQCFCITTKNLQFATSCKNCMYKIPPSKKYDAFSKLFQEKLTLKFRYWNGTVKIAYKKTASQINAACRIHTIPNVHFWTKISTAVLKMFRILAWQL